MNECDEAEIRAQMKNNELSGAIVALDMWKGIAENRAGGEGRIS